MLELDWIRRELVDRRPSMVAEETGLHVNTVKDIRDGKNTNPKLATLNKLSAYLKKGEA